MYNKLPYCLSNFRQLPLLSSPLFTPLSSNTHCGFSLKLCDCDPSKPNRKAVQNQSCYTNTVVWCWLLHCQQKQKYHNICSTLILLWYKQLLWSVWNVTTERMGLSQVWWWSLRMNGQWTRFLWKQLHLSFYWVYYFDSYWLWITYCTVLYIVLHWYTSTHKS